MATVTIHRESGHVTVDGEGRKVDMAPLPADQDVIQWTGTKGTIQFKQAPDVDQTTFKLNEPITSFAPYQWAVDAWTAVGPPPPPEPPPVTQKLAPGGLVLFDHENRIRAQEGAPALSLADFEAKMRGK